MRSSYIRTDLTVAIGMRITRNLAKDHFYLLVNTVEHGKMRTFEILELEKILQFSLRVEIIQVVR